MRKYGNHAMFSSLQQVPLPYDNDKIRQNSCLEISASASKLAFEYNYSILYGKNRFLELKGSFICFCQTRYFQ